MTSRRADQLLSRYGYCSRSEARAWIRSGRVAAGGTLVRAPEEKVDPETLCIDGQPVECPGGLLALYHKPAGFVCSHDSREGATIYDQLPPLWALRNPAVTSVGRLDKDTTGLLLLTDIGALVQRWTSPGHKVPKVYEVTVDADLGPELVGLFASGELELEGEAKSCLPAQLEILDPRRARLTLNEGKYHQVKRMFASQGLSVTRLHRAGFGDFNLDGLEPGQWRLLEPASYSGNGTLE